MKVLILLALVFLAGCYAGHNVQQQQQYRHPGPGPQLYRGHRHEQQEEEQEEQQQGHQQQQHYRYPQEYKHRHQFKHQYRPYRGHQQKYQVEMVKDAFWDYVGESIKCDKDYVWHIRRSPPGRSLCEIISTSLEIISSFFHLIRKQIVFWLNDMFYKFICEVDRMKYHMEVFLVDLDSDFKYHSKELAVDICFKIEELKRCAAFYMESLDPKGLRDALLRKLEEILEQLDDCFEDVDPHHGHYRRYHRHRHPDLKIYKTLEDFKAIVIIITQEFEIKLAQTTNEINKHIPHRKKYQIKPETKPDITQEQLKNMWQDWCLYTKKC